MGDGLAYIYLGGPCLIVTLSSIFLRWCASLFQLNPRRKQRRGREGEGKEREEGEGKREGGGRGRWREEMHGFGSVKITSQSREKSSIEKELD